MSSDAQKNAPPLQLTTDQVTDFLRAVGAGFACPICKTVAWQTLTTGAEDAIALPVMQTDGGSDFSRLLRAYTLLCSNCGFIWMMSRNRIEAWVKDGGVKK